MTVPGHQVSRGQFVEIAVPFRHARPEARVEFRVVASGPGGVAVDAVRVEPDLPALFRMTLDPLDAALAQTASPSQ